jgi:1-deoxy-D-xylulose-5-phosphate reductoisomerase
MKRLAILGSTGSIGQSALSVVDAHPDRLSVVALAAGHNADGMAEQVARYRPSIVAMASEHSAALVRERLTAPVPDVRGDADALVAVASHPEADIVICASAGTAALEAVMAAIALGKTVALANKEVLVLAGSLVMAAARERGVAVLPIDSEHNAVHQCLHGREAGELRRIILTASGGPFRDLSMRELEHVDAVAALRHPTWRMGRKITIDSATLMNKGLEVIEAHWLFDVSADQIDVVVHPQSIVHSMVELTDGSLIAQLGVTDMRLPIQYACSYPDRWEAALPRLDLVKAGTLEFHAPARDRFPCLDLAYEALRAGGTMPGVLNAANEVAVEAFLDGTLGFLAIPRVIRNVMDRHRLEPVTSVEVVRTVDAWARAQARTAVEALKLKS